MQAALTAPAPAEASLLASLAAGRAKAATAIAAVMRDCAAIDCARDDPQLTGFAGSVERLNALRRDTDAAMRLPIAERPSGLTAAWAAATTVLLARFDRISETLTEQIKIGDPIIAELMEVKQIGWLVRDKAGLERNFYSDSINTKSLPVATRIGIAGYRGSIDAGWGLARTDRPAWRARRHRRRHARRRHEFLWLL